MAVTESWGRSFLLVSFITLDGYALFRQDRCDGVGGGVFLLVKQSLSPSSYVISSEESVPKFEDSVWCSIPIFPHKSLLVGCLYRSPSSSSHNDSLLEALFDQMTEAPFDFRLLAGDFNCPKIDWDRMSSSPSNQFLLECCQNNYLFQTVKTPTRDNSVLDLVFVNDLSFLSSVTVTEKFPGSDHMTVSCKLVFDTTRSSDASPDGLIGKSKLDFRRADWQRFRLLLSSAPWKVFMNVKNVDVMWDKIKSTILDAAHQCIPKRASARRVSGVPLTGEVRLAFRNRKRVFRSLRGSNSSLAVNLRTQADVLLQGALSSSRKVHENSIAFDCKVNPKRFWAHVRSTLGSKPVVSSVFDANDHLTDNSLDTANCFNEYFCSVFTNEDENIALPSLAPKTKILCDTFQISEEAVASIIRSLPKYSSPGPDGIANMFLKEGGQSLIECLVFFFRFLLSNETLPTEWKSAIVIPIFKKGVRTKCSNYRPVSLTCSICKIFERLVKDCMMRHLQENQLLNESQHGFLPLRSCCTAILSFLNDVITAVDDRWLVDAVYLDLSKAFDSIPHKRLTLKLRRFGFSGHLLNWISAYLSKRTQRVRVGESVSIDLPVVSGVPQGSVLGPLLFIIFMDDIDECIQESKIIKFADDTKIYISFSPSDPVRSNFLQDDLLSISNWCSTWLLQLNFEKCACVHFGLHNPSRTYCIDDNQISNVDSVLDLGVVITNDLKPSTHCLRAISKAQKMLSVMKLAFKYLDIDALTILYKAFVLPLLDYCCVAWCPFYVKDVNALEKVQRRFTRFLSIHRDLPYEDRLIKYKISSLYARRLQFDLLCMYKLVHGLMHIPFHTMFELVSSSRTRGHNFRVKVKYSRLDIRNHWFSSRVVPLWNNLPSVCVEASSIFSFKELLHKHLLSIGIR